MPLGCDGASDNQESGVRWGSIPRHSTKSRQVRSSRFLGTARSGTARYGEAGHGAVCRDLSGLGRATLIPGQERGCEARQSDVL